MDVLEGKEGNFCIRRNFSKDTKEAVMWPDSQLSDFLYRHKDLTSLCCYEQMITKDIQRNEQDSAPE